ncbi:MAG: helix-turn-helix transcriptional regulator [Actinomycetota bacterium]|nr:helix-turn-helix transcriptional regulator [Actinomycetota bacterium]
MKPDGVRGHLDLVLLGILADGAGHGYRVIMELRARTEGALDLPEGSVYPALHRLEKAGLLASDWEAGPVRRRRVYRLTEQGHAALATGRRDWRALVAAIDAVVVPPARISEGLA